MANSVWCRCPCHHDREADLRDAMQRGDQFAVAYYAHDDHLQIPPMVAVNDPVECCVATGCPCVTHHLNIWGQRPYRPPRQWKPGDDE